MIDLRPFGGGNILADCTAQLAGAFLGGTFRGPRYDVVPGEPVNQVRFLFSNIGYGGSNDIGGPGSLTIACTVEKDTSATGNQLTSTKYPLTFDGRIFARLDPYGFVWSDPINPDVQAGQFLWPRTYVVSESGAGYPCTFISSSAYGEGWDIAAIQPISDKRDSGTITVQSSQKLFGPIQAIGCRTNDTLPVIGIYGDSIITGAVDSASGIYYSYRLGWANRGIAGRIPVVQTGRGGTAAAHVRHLRNTSMDVCNHVIIGLGTNDESGTEATTENNLLRWARQFKSMGPETWICTIPPKTTSTDEWVTVENQSITSFDSKRVSINSWIRAGAPIDSSGMAVAIGTPGAITMGASHPMKNYLEVANALESAQDSGFWKSGYTSDGIHPNQTGHIAASALLSDLSPFGY